MIMIDPEEQKKENIKSLILGIIFLLASLGLFFGGAIAAGVYDVIPAGPIMMVVGFIIFWPAVMLFGNIRSAKNETCPGCGKRMLLMGVENKNTYRKVLSEKVVYKEHEGTDTKVTFDFNDKTATIHEGSNGWSEPIGKNVTYGCYSKCPNCGYEIEFKKVTEFVKIEK